MNQLTLDIEARRIHIAVMRKSWNLLEKILSGEKKIESRWYLNKSAPWDEIDEDDLIYFKNSGEPVTLEARVAEVKQFSSLTPNKVRELIAKFGDKAGLDIGKLEHFFELFKDKKYCILIFLKDVKKVDPFEIEKNGFGTMSAWIVIDDIDKIKKIKSPLFKQRSLLGRK